MIIEQSPLQDTDNRIFIMSIVATALLVKLFELLA